MQIEIPEDIARQLKSFCARVNERGHPPHGRPATEQDVIRLALEALSCLHRLTGIVDQS